MQRADNAFLDFSGLPRFAALRGQDADAAVDKVLADLERAADRAAEAPPEWDLTVARLEEAEEAAHRVWNLVEHMHSVRSGEEWRAAHRNNLEKVAAAYAKLGQHEKLCQNLRRLQKSGAPLSAARQKIIQDALLDFELSGVGLSGEKKAKFRKNSARLSELAAKFEENLLDATKENPTDAAAEDLGEMPEDLRRAAKHGEGWRFTLSPPSYAAFMQYSPAREKRREMYFHYNTRASEFGPAARDNSPLIGEITKLRAEQARLLGFADYAELALQTRMARTPKAALDFLRDLAARARPHAAREMEELREFAAADLGIDDLRRWDFAFASEKLRRKTFDFSAAELRPYLQTDKILAGLFGCVQKLFGAELREADAPGRLDFVRYFQVRGQNGAAGGMFLDLFAREDKRGGAWVSDAVSRFWRGGKLQTPAAHVVCNFTPPDKDGAALLNWEEAQTLFHEFGHALHHVLTEADDYSASGMNGVEWDAVELPSQFMENFIWDWEVLRPFTKHVKTGAEMPRELFDRARAARTFQAGMRLMRQLEFALFDMSMHAGAPRPFMETLAEVRQDTAVLAAPEWDRFPCGFSHIFSGGYAAGYYSYLWAEVLAADLFAMFAESGRALNSELGEIVRREILAAGGGRPAMESFVAARGRAPDSSALLKHYGL